MTIAVRLVLPFLIAIPLGFIWFSRSEALQISYRKLLAEATELAKSANTDPLTGLLNRRSFEMQFELSQAHSVGGLFVIADMDYLKSINDEYGHLMGDEAIVATAIALQQALPSDSLIARIGGDEFCAFLPGGSVEQLEALRAKFNEVATFEFKRRSALPEESLTISLGQTHCRRGLAFKDALSQADSNLYLKKRGRVSVSNARHCRGPHRDSDPASVLT